MICPYCGSYNTKVYDTRQFPSCRWRRYEYDVVMELI